MHYVIGDGPAGISCAAALIEAGKEVTILDGGMKLEAEREAVRQSAAKKPRSQWSPEEINVLRTIVPKNGEVPLKLAYGSDYPYRRVPGSPDIRYGSLNIRASYAQGGLSNVWGAALLPYFVKDIADWPISADDLAAHYATVAKWLPISGEDDDIARLYPVAGMSLHPLRYSRQIKNLLRRAAERKQQLNANGLYLGGARIAVSAGDGSGADGCYYCGYCLHGCPRDVVYSSRHTLAALRQNPRVHYLPGRVVRTIREENDKVLLDVVSGNGAETLVGERAYLAAGTLSSTAILLRSLGRYGQAVTFRDSQYYLFPMLQTRAVSHVAKEDLYTLSQSFLEIFDRSISPYTVHLQVYSYNDHLDQILGLKLGPLKWIFPKNMLLGRFLLIQGYLHSDHSGTISGTLLHNGDDDVFQLTPKRNPETKRLVHKVLLKLAGQAYNLGAFPVFPLLEVTEPGRGFHTGGSFPMARTPNAWQTDVLGRPYGMARTHVVDATVLPSIPATTITFSTMANAHRIGTEAAKL